MKRTPMTRKTPMNRGSGFGRTNPLPPREAPAAPPMDLVAARAAMARQAASLATPRQDMRAAPKPDLVVKARPSGFPPVVRQTILDRDHGACVRCGVPIESSSVGYSLQHRNARQMGGTSDPRINQTGNGVVLCGSATTGCHGWVEQTDPVAATRAGYAVEGWADPVSVPMLTMRDGWVRIDNNGGRWQVPTPPDGDAHAAAQRLGAWK